MNEQFKDGGPAFPAHGSMGEVAWDGMSLRDYYAGEALKGLLANPGGPIQANGMQGWGLTNCTDESVADVCWRMADAMLKARQP